MNSRGEVEVRRQNRARLNAADRYLEIVFRRTLGILVTLQVLDDARRMLRTFPSQLGRGVGGLTRDRWVDYHYGYFTVSLASLSDVGFLLAASVLQIGLAPKHCTPDTLLSHDSVKGRAVASALRDLLKSVQQVKSRRNVHVHRAEHADVADLLPDGSLRNIKLVAAVLPELDLSSSHQQLLRAAWRQATAKVIRRLDEEVEAVEDALSKVFDALLSPFTLRYGLLRTRATKRSTARH